jgi:BirA family biotin operon repressor/biotin-[acetyl-CoA-carboxylase] ligase
MLPSNLSATTISDAINTSLLGNKVMYFRSVPSTMDVAFEAAMNGAPEGTLVIAEEQSLGRGRFQRTWISPHGLNLYLSLVLNPLLNEIPQIGMMASLGIVKSIAKLAPDIDTPAIKWPNDVIVRGRKIAGILIDNTLSEQDKPAISILGIGFNVNLETKSIPDIKNSATSLLEELGHPTSRLQALITTLNEIEQLYLEIKAGNSIRKKWAHSIDTIGRRVQVSWQEKRYVGVARDVDENGSLIIEGEDGSETSLPAGEVTLRS